MAYQAALAALADPTRREVFEQLRSGPRAVGEIASDMPVSRPAVSQHLKVLKLAGLVNDRAAGTRRVYYIDPNGLGALRKWLDQFWDQALTAFQAEIERPNEPSPGPQSKGKSDEPHHHSPLSKGRLHEPHHHGRARPQKRSRQRRSRTRF